LIRIRLLASPFWVLYPPGNHVEMSLPSSSPIDAPAHVLELLTQLHKLSLEQEVTLKGNKDEHFVSTNAPKTPVSFDDLMRDKFIALDQDKCHFVYQLIRATGITTAIEAGTSFGVSTIYLALAISKNKSFLGIRMGSPGVIATELEPSKALRAREYWKRCGEDVEAQIDLRVGDLQETLKGNLPGNIGLLLLDIWAPLALPTLRLAQPKLQPGAVVLVDNTITAAEGYKGLFEYINRPGSGFKTITLPYSGGFDMIVYYPN
jgi:predicted O-methyltransferase YrrM